MEIVVDDRSGWAVRTEGRTLGEVFEEARRHVASKKRSIVALVLDGETLTREQQDRIAPESAGKYGLLEVKTIDPLSVALSTLTGLIPHVTNLDQLHEQGSALVRAGDLSKAGEKLSQCVDNWDILARAVRDIGMLSGADFRTLMVHGDPAESKIRKLQQVLLKYRMAIDVRDLDRVADISDRELRPLLKDWRGLLEALSAHVARQAGVVK